MRTRRLAPLASAVLLSTGSLVTLGAAPSSAAPVCDIPTYRYTFTNVSSPWKATSLASSYVKGPGSVSITKGRTWTVSASMTATVSAEAGIVFAKASASLGITVGASYSGTQSFTYTLNVPSGQTKRLQQYKRTRHFTVNKYQLNRRTCGYDFKVYSSAVTAPVKSTADKYFLYALAG